MARPVELAGRVIAVTGASSGIGLATALACARAGMRVALLARRADRLADAVAAVSALGGHAVAYSGDVAEAGAAERFLAEAEGALGPMYAVFANAGYGFEKPFAETSDAEVRGIFEVNLFASLALARAAVPGMRARGAGHVLFCSSCLSKIGLPMYGAYCATKAGQDHFARAMRHELAGTGVCVSSVHPIGTRTEFFDRAADRSGGELRLMDRARQRFLQPAERVADAVVRCLRRPRGEVWTSASTRLALAASVAAPGLTDWALSRMARSRRGE